LGVHDFVFVLFLFLLLKPSCTPASQRLSGVPLASHLTAGLPSHVFSPSCARVVFRRASPLLASTGSVLSRLPTGKRQKARLCSRESTRKRGSASPSWPLAFPGPRYPLARISAPSVRNRHHAGLFLGSAVGAIRQAQSIPSASNLWTYVIYALPTYRYTVAKLMFP
jgi:hypothetical protein